MNENFYDIYFDPAELEVDGNGDLINPDVLHIICFECDTDTGEAINTNRVNKKGEIIETDPVLTDLQHVGDGDDNTIREALNRFELWLENHLEWRVSRMETRYTPAEYVCIGIEGYIDEDTEFYYKRHWWR